MIFTHLSKKSQQPDPEVFHKSSNSKRKSALRKHESLSSASMSEAEKDEELAKKDVEILKLTNEIKLLRASASAASVIEKECQRQRSLIDTQRKEIEDLQIKLARIDSEAKVPPQHLNVKSYLAGVKMNLTTLEKENEQLEEEINEVSSC